MKKPVFDGNILSGSDQIIFKEVLGFPAQLETYKVRQPELVIVTQGKPYLFRWHIVRTDHCGVNLHVVVGNDANRDHHDHPWDNTTVMLAGKYREESFQHPKMKLGRQDRTLMAGDVVHRLATYAHRLVLPEGTPYAMSLFSFGPRTRDWGFYTDKGWTPHNKICEIVGGVARMRGEKDD